MLRYCDKNLIIRTQLRSAETVSDQVQALGRVARKYDLFRRCRTDESAHSLPRIFIRIRRTDAQIIKPAQRIRIRLAVICGLGFDHRRGLLRGCGAVQIDHIRKLRKYGEIILP